MIRFFGLHFRRMEFGFTDFSSVKFKICDLSLCLFFVGPTVYHPFDSLIFACASFRAAFMAFLACIKLPPRSSIICLLLSAVTLLRSSSMKAPNFPFRHILTSRRAARSSSGTPPRIRQPVRRATESSKVWISLVGSEKAVYLVGSY